MKDGSSESEPSKDGVSSRLGAVFKYKLLDGLRATGALKLVDLFHYWLHRCRMMPGNLAFKRRNPGFHVPPFDLAFDAYNNINWDFYKNVGRVHASIFTDIVKHDSPPGELSILEWGCGPGRLIRHLDELLVG